MTRLEKIEMAIQKGFTCDISSGKVYGIKGDEITRKHKSGYTLLAFRNGKKSYNILAHQFIWYVANKEVAELIDHINQNKSDNRISNLRSANHSINAQNKNDAKGYSKYKEKWRARIKINQKDIILGFFDNEDDARKAYLNAKKIYHIQ